MKTIICNIKLFDLIQQIQVIDENNCAETIGVSHTDGLGSNIAMLAEQYGIDHIHLYGIEDYVSHTVSEINNYNAIKYGNRPLYIEVN